VFLCCEACREALLDEPAKYLAMLSEGWQSSASDKVEVDLPEIGKIELIPTDPPSETSPEGREQEVVR
jgi:hypothetical protein